jgi:hypothetical protein
VRRVQRRDPRDPPEHARAELRHARAVGRGGAVALGVVQERLQAVVVRARDVRARVDDDPADELALVRPPHARLGGRDGEALVAGDLRGDADQRARGHVGRPGEREVVGVARVGGEQGGGEAREPPVEAVAASDASAGEVGAPCGRSGVASRRPSRR